MRYRLSLTAPDMNFSEIISNSRVYLQSLTDLNYVVDSEDSSNWDIFISLKYYNPVMVLWRTKKMNWGLSSSTKQICFIVS